MPLTQSSLVGREEEATSQSGPIHTLPFWQQTLAEMKRVGQCLQYPAPDSSSPGSVALWSAQHAILVGIGLIRYLSHSLMVVWQTASLRATKAREKT